MENIKPFVDFMIVGAMKSGTTTLADILGKHDRICFSSTKEPQFFSESPDWKKEIARYRALFPEVTEGQLIGEASTGYTMFPEFNKEVWRDIYAFNPGMKIVYIMRDPIMRVMSHYTHNYMRGYTRLPFDEAALKIPEYINRSRYYTQIKPYIDTFGREQVLLITFEAFLSQQEEVLRAVAEFLGIESSFPEHGQVHSNKAREDFNITDNRYLRGKIKSPVLVKALNVLYKWLYGATGDQPVMTEDFEALLWRMLEQDIDNIEEEMGRALNEWPSCVKYKYERRERAAAFVQDAGGVPIRHS
jgi:hypothetical protein